MEKLSLHPRFIYRKYKKVKACDSHFLKQDSSSVNVSFFFLLAEATPSFMLPTFSRLNQPIRSKKASTAVSSRLASRTRARHTFLGDD